MTTMRDVLTEHVGRYLKISNGISGFQTVWIVKILEDSIIVAAREDSTQCTVLALRTVQAIMIENQT